jgi:hypothetical protein
MWLEAYAIPDKEESMLAEALVSNVCRFGML